MICSHVIADSKVNHCDLPRSVLHRLAGAEVDGRSDHVAQQQSERYRPAESAVTVRGYGSQHNSIVLADADRRHEGK